MATKPKPTPLTITVAEQVTMEGPNYRAVGNLTSWAMSADPFTTSDLEKFLKVVYTELQDELVEVVCSPGKLTARQSVQVAP